jgi:hypothetical protein
MSEPEGGVSGGFAFVQDDTHRNDPRKLYSLFRGEPEAPSGHLAMAALRRPGDGLYAKPFRQYGVDCRLLPDGGGGITESITADGLIVSFEQEASGEPLLVYGFVAEHVVGVDVIVAGRTVPARLENNAYAALVEAEPDDLETVVLYRADGTSVRI